MVICVMRIMECVLQQDVNVERIPHVDRTVLEVSSLI